jgi:CRP-like cAMP-binding protein
MEADFFDRPLKPVGDIDIDAAYNQIFSLFAKLIPVIPDDLFNRFRQISFPISFGRDQVLLDYGDICKHAYFAMSGLVRLTRILQGRGETTIMFLTGGDILISPNSFYTQRMSIEKLTALTDTFCIALPWSELQGLYRDFIEFNIGARLLTEHYYRQALERTTWFYENAELRYEHFLKAYPEVAGYVSVTELASYLGIARETLSRIRHRITRKGKKRKT